MSEKITNYNPFDYFDTQAEINSFLLDCYNDDDPNTFVTALGHLARHHGMTEMAKETGLSRGSLYKTFNGKTKPQWETIVKLLKALNVQLTVAV